MAKASTKALDALHCQLASVLKSSIEGYVGAEDTKGLASILNVARQFLKDNDIAGLAAEGSAIKSLAESLPFIGNEIHGDDGEAFPTH
jgi:hypothetical protein